MVGIRGIVSALSLIALTLPVAAHAQWSIVEGEPKQSKVSFLVQEFTKEEWDQSSFAPPEDVEAFKDLRFGIMINFGLTAKSKTDISWGYITPNERKAPDGNALSDGHSLPMSEWARWDKDVKLENFNAKQWVAFAKASGFKYIVVLAKHHEGFHMWDTAFSDYKITNTPFGRDYIKEVADACHEAKMPIGIYYSQRDWHHPDYQPVGWGPDKSEAGPLHQKYIDYQFNAVRELLTKYGKIDILWWDANWWGGMFRKEHWDSERLTRMVRELQPHIVINNRNSVPADFDTPEQRMGVFQNDRAWEAAVSLEDTWSYSGVNAKTREQVINLLVKSAVNGGNLNLSLGVHWSGEFDPNEVKIMTSVGDWLRLNGKSIYSTRGGPWKSSTWGGSTWNGATAYLHVLDLKGEKVFLRSVPGNKVRSAHVLFTGNDGKVSNRAIGFTEKNGTIEVNVPKSLQNGIDTIVTIAMSKSLKGVTALEPLQISAVGATGKNPGKPFDYELVYGNRTQEAAGLTASAFAQPLVPSDVTKLIQEGGSAGFAVSTVAQAHPWVQLDLGKSTFITGVYLDAAANGQPLTVLLSNDGVKFTQVWKTDPHEPAGPWQIEVNDFIAGAQTPGREARYVRISTADGADAALTVKQLGTWSKASK